MRAAARTRERMAGGCEPPSADTRSRRRPPLQLAATLEGCVGLQVAAHLPAQCPRECEMWRVRGSGIGWAEGGCAEAAGGDRRTR